jgi:pSer/pThr/pTyr-binding forkhead associated (FHA) protein
LIQEAEEMGSARYTAHSRKHMHTSAFYTMTSRHGETAALRSRERLQNTQSMKAVSHQDNGTINRREGETPSHVTWRDQTFVLDKDLMRVGRASQNEIVIAEKGVSRFHCQITRQGDKLIMEDLDSTNGTMMRGEVLTEPVTLSVGDVAYLCDAKLVFHDGSL